MKRLIAMMGCAVLLAAAPALAQTKTVKGSVTNVGASSITVKVDGKDMTFNVDAKTTVVAKGASTKTREAQAAGKTGPGITEVVKTGEPVEVVYHEQDMHAATVRAISAVPAPAAAKSAAPHGEAAAKPHGEAADAEADPPGGGRLPPQRGSLTRLLARLQVHLVQRHVPVCVEDFEPPLFLAGKLRRVRIQALHDLGVAGRSGHGSDVAIDNH